jgi:hypothetical protein
MMTIERPTRVTANDLVSAFWLWLSENCAWYLNLVTISKLLEWVLKLQ